MKEYVYLRAKEYKKYVEVICRFEYLGRSMIIHKPLQVESPYYTISDELTGMCMGNLILKTPTKRAAIMQLNKVKDSIRKLTPEMYKEYEKQLAAVPPYHKWKKMPF